MQPRSLLPREHGAYGQLGFPILSGLVAGRPGAASALLAAAAVTAFFVHEPALVFFGRRGQHARETSGSRALRFGLACAALAVALLAAGLRLSPPAARLAAAISVGLGLLLGAMVALGIEKTLPGELIAAAAMTSAGFMVGEASGLPWRTGTAMWATWLLGFAAAVFPVRAIIVEHKQRSQSTAARIVPTLIVPATAVLLVALGEVPRDIAASATPLYMAAFYVAIKPPTMKKMTRAGWLLMAAGALTTLWMTLAVKR